VREEDGWWLERDEFEQAARQVEETDTNLLAALVGRPAVIEHPIESEEDHDRPDQGMLDSQQVLPALATWWQANRVRWLAWYHERVYPSHLRSLIAPGGGLALTMDDLGSDIEGRKRWLSLFILGMMHSMGRGGQFGQQNRNFLELCQRQGWLDVFADPNTHGRRADWVDVVDRYIDSQQGDPEYFFWLRQLFISIRAVAVRLADYAEAFRALRSKGAVRLSDVLRPRNSVVFQGGGVDPPSLARILSLGASFVTRELVRGGFIPRDRVEVHRFCYPPVRSVRVLLARMGCDGLEASDPDSWNRSEIIHGFLSNHLDDPTFGGDYDIPLWLVSRVPSIQEAVLGVSDAFPGKVDEWE
jgi:hypothetical protein